MSDENTDDEFKYAVDLSLTRPTVLTFSRTSVGPTKTSEKKNVPAAGPSNTDDKKQNVDAEASETKAVILLPKKRPYVVPQTQSEEKQITDNIAIVGEQIEAAEQVITALSTNQVQNQSGATDKKSQASELTASDKPTVKPVRETGKKKSQKTSASKPSTGQASTLQPSALETLKSQTSTSKASKSKASKSKASKSKESTSKQSKSKSQELTSKTTKKTTSTPDNSEIRKGANVNLPSGKELSASTSAASSSSSSADTHIWLETLKSKFQCSSYENMLRQSNFTERQAAALKNVFHQTSRQWHNAFMNIDRITKIHSCRECGFSIWHQCVSINYLPAGWPRPDPKIPTVFAPHTTTICICRFAFFHDDISRPSLSKTVNTGSSKRIIAKLRCPVCDTVVMIEHPQVENTGCTLTKWSGINGSNEQVFHAELDNHLKTITQQTLSLDELYTCNHHCCLFFHRCRE
ncbi:N protein 2 [Diadegma fenestrale ichnovirus]|nr:N protein 2 [Diadegma fenestrale ichnovirus]